MFFLLTPAELTRIALLQPQLRNAVPSLVQDIEDATGKRVSIPPNGGWRSYATQAALFANRATNPYPVVAPGTSYHEVGAAVDLDIVGGTAADYSAMWAIATAKYGFVVPAGDRVHVRLNESLAQAQADWAALTSTRWSYLLIGGVVVGIAAFSLEED